MAEPFNERPVPGRSWLKRLFRPAEPDAALVEIGNLLGRAIAVTDVTSADLQQIEERYSFDIQLRLMP